MRKTVAIILVLVLSANLFADALPKYEPYRDEEFPIWSQQLRRGETLFFGSLVITLPIVTLGTTLINSMGGNIPTDNAVGLRLGQAGVACVLSLGIALADYFIGRAQESKNAK